MFWSFAWLMAGAFGFFAAEGELAWTLLIMSLVATLLQSANRARELQQAAARDVRVWHFEDQEIENVKRSRTPTEEFAPIDHLQSHVAIIASRAKGSDDLLRDRQRELVRFEILRAGLIGIAGALLFACARAFFAPRTTWPPAPDPQTTIFLVTLVAFLVALFFVAVLTKMTWERRMARDEAADALTLGSRRLALRRADLAEAIARSSSATSRPSM